MPTRQSELGWPKILVNLLLSSTDQAGLGAAVGYSLVETASTVSGTENPICCAWANISQANSCHGRVTSVVIQAPGAIALAHWFQGRDDGLGQVAGKGRTADLIGYHA